MTEIEKLTIATEVKEMLEKNNIPAGLLLTVKDDNVTLLRSNANCKEQETIDMFEAILKKILDEIANDLGSSDFNIL